MVACLFLQFLAEHRGGQLTLVSSLDTGGVGDQSLEQKLAFLESPGPTTAFFLPGLFKFKVFIWQDSLSWIHFLSWMTFLWSCGDGSSSVFTGLYKSDLEGQ